MHNLKWFTSKIGTRIYRDKGTCKCKTCKDVEDNGLIIHDKIDAECLHMYQEIHIYRLTK